MSNCFERPHPEQDGNCIVSDSRDEYPVVPVSSWGDSKVYPRSAYQQHRVLHILVPAIPLILLAAGSLAAAFFYPAVAGFLTSINPATANISDTAPSHTFSVGTHPKIIVNDVSGRVLVQAGASNQVVINVRGCACGSSGGYWHRHMGWSPEQAQPAISPVHYQQSGNEITVTAGDEAQSASYADEFASENLIVFVPAISDVQVQTGPSDAQVTGVNGQLVVDSTDGDILISDTQGQVTAHSESGDIVLRRVVLSGQTTLSGTNGDISVVGVLKPDGTYQLNSDHGDVGLILPAAAAFLLQAHAGRIENAFGNNQSGTAPYAHLNVQAINGDLFLKKDWS